MSGGGPIPDRTERDRARSMAGRTQATKRTGAAPARIRSMPNAARQVNVPADVHSRTGSSWSERTYEFRVGGEIPAALARAAKNVVHPGDPISTAQLRALRRVAQTHGGFNQRQRMFLAGLLDPENTRTLARTPMRPGAPIGFSLASIRTGMPRVRALGRPRSRPVPDGQARREMARRDAIGTLARAAATAQPTRARSPVTDRDRAEMKADVEQIVAELRSSFFTDEWKIAGFALKWSERDRVLQEQTDYAGTDYIDAFVLETQKRAYSRHTAGGAWVERFGIVYDDVWHELRGERLAVWRDRVSKSRQGTSGPRQGPPENFWKTLSRQEAIGLWGMLKGMGTTAAAGLVDAPAQAIVHALQWAGVPATDPDSVAAWLQKQYDISGEAMLGKEYSHGDPLFLGMNARDVGAGGGAIVWQLVMLGTGKGAASWATKALQLLGIGGNLEKIAESANTLAKIALARQAGGKLTASELANDPEFRQASTTLVANIVGAVSGAIGFGNAKFDAPVKATLEAWKAAGLVVSGAQVGERLGSCIQEGLSSDPPGEKERKIASMLGEAISAAIEVAVGVHELREAAAGKAKQPRAAPERETPPAPPQDEPGSKVPEGGPPTPAPKVEEPVTPPSPDIEEPVTPPAATEGPQAADEPSAQTGASPPRAEVQRRIQELRATYGDIAADKPAFKREVKALEQLAQADPEAASQRLDAFAELANEPRGGEEEAGPELVVEETEARTEGRLQVRHGLPPDVTTTEKLEGEYDVEKLVPADQAARQAGNIYDDLGRWGSPDRVSELWVEGPSGRARLDAYEPNREIISRKSGDTGQLASLGYDGALAHLQELTSTYPPGAVIADVPSSPPHLVGKPLAGQMILEVPPQISPVPADVLKAAQARNIVIRDWLGKVYAVAP